MGVQSNFFDHEINELTGQEIAAVRDERRLPQRDLCVHVWHQTVLNTAIIRALVRARVTGVEAAHADVLQYAVVQRAVLLEDPVVDARIASLAGAIVGCVAEREELDGHVGLVREGRGTVEVGGLDAVDVHEVWAGRACGKTIVELGEERGGW